MALDSIKEGGTRILQGMGITPANSEIERETQNEAKGKVVVARSESDGYVGRYRSNLNTCGKKCVYYSTIALVMVLSSAFTVGVMEGVKVFNADSSDSNPTNTGTPEIIVKAGAEKPLDESLLKQSDGSNFESSAAVTEEKPLDESLLKQSDGSNFKSSAAVTEGCQTHSGHALDCFEQIWDGSSIEGSIINYICKGKRRKMTYCNPMVTLQCKGKEWAVVKYRDLFNCECVDDISTHREAMEKFGVTKFYLRLLTGEISANSTELDKTEPYCEEKPLRNVNCAWTDWYLTVPVTYKSVGKRGLGDIATYYCSSFNSCYVKKIIVCGDDRKWNTIYNDEAVCDCGQNENSADSFQSIFHFREKRKASRKQ